MAMRKSGIIYCEKMQDGKVKGEFTVDLRTTRAGNGLGQVPLNQAKGEVMGKEVWEKGFLLGAGR